jgi:hypothetical protein
MFVLGGTMIGRTTNEAKKPQQMWTMSEYDFQIESVDIKNGIQLPDSKNAARANHIIPVVAETQLIPERKADERLSYSVVLDTEEGDAADPDYQVTQHHLKGSAGHHNGRRFRSAAGRSGRGQFRRLLRKAHDKNMRRSKR